MPRLRTTKVQLSGYRLLVQRTLDAFIRRDTRLLPSPFTSHTNAVALGGVLIALFALAGLAVSLFTGPTGVGNADYVVTKSGAQYVKYGNAWHPVTNAVSASLITGNAQNPQSVGDDALKQEPRGLPMGIPGAPEQIAVAPHQDRHAAVCSAEIGRPNDDPNAAFRVDTLFIAGDELAMEPLRDDTATLVTVADKSKYWLVFDGKRGEVVMADDTIRAALGIDKTVEDHAVVVSPKFLNTLTTVPRIQPPSIGTGQGSTGYAIGTVLAQEMPGTASTFYVATSKGVQQINEAVARILVTAGSEMVRNPSVSVINNATRTDDINIEHYPKKLPSYVQDKTLCAQWEKPDDPGKGTVRVFVNDVIKLKDSALRREDLTPTVSGGDGPSIDRFYTGGAGQGWFYQVTDLQEDPVTEAAVFYVSPEGVRYPIGGDDNGDVNNTVRILGLDATLPVQLPWQYLQLLPEGPTLSPTNAITLWETIPVPEQQLAPRRDGAVERPTSTTPQPADEEL